MTIKEKRGFSIECAHKFYKHFPQWQNYVPTEIQEEIEQFLHEITWCFKSDNAWNILESNFLLMKIFHHHVTYLLQPKLAPVALWYAWGWAVLWVLGWCLMACLRDYVPISWLTSGGMGLSALALMLRAQLRTKSLTPSVFQREQSSEQSLWKNNAWQASPTESAPCKMASRDQIGLDKALSDHNSQDHSITDRTPCGAGMCSTCGVHNVCDSQNHHNW